MGCWAERVERRTGVDLRTGNALSLPAYLPVETYPVRVRDDGMIVIEVGG